MCLIISGNSNKIRSTLLDTHGLLADIYSSNPDGIGIMYGTSKGLKVNKFLPKNIGEARNMIERMPQDDRDLAIHFRWTTHGHTDLSNCHPYDVVPGFIAMMHNGVLHTGNAADTARSDTYHFIKDYLHDTVVKYPDIVYDQGFLTMVAEFIGDNRFVFMNGEGRISHVNYDQGVEHDGMWFSNTYAWKPSKLIPNYYKSTKRAWHGHLSNGYEMWDDGDEEIIGSWSSAGTEFKSTKGIHAMTDNEFAKQEANTNVPSAYELGDALMQADAELLSAYFDEMPITCINIIMDTFEATLTMYKPTNDFESEVIAACLDNDIATMHDFVRNDPETVAEVMCWHLNWAYQPLKVPALV